MKRLLISEGDGYQIVYEKMSSSFGKHRFAIVSFPRSLKHHVLLHTLFGHELGHTAQDTYVVDAKIAALVQEALASAGPLSSAAAANAWLSDILAPPEVKAELELLTISGAPIVFAEVDVKSWLTEMICDLFGLMLFVEVLGGSVAFSAILPGGESCGHLFAGTPTECLSAIGDLYVETDWLRGFGFWRPSQYAGASPIFEGLSVLLGFGVVFPTGDYDAALSYGSGPVIGTNIYDFAPSIAINYVTSPILADGTEFAAKLYWNNYTENGDTHYHSGALISIDFAMTERIGLVQAGITGTYSKQIEDDRFNGIPVSPDGRRFEVLTLGGVVQVDIPELKAVVRAKAVSTVHVENSVESWGITLAWLQAF